MNETGVCACLVASQCCQDILGVTADLPLSHVPAVPVTPAPLAVLNFVQNFQGRLSLAHNNELNACEGPWSQARGPGDFWIASWFNFFEFFDTKCSEQGTIKLAALSVNLNVIGTWDRLQSYGFVAKIRVPDTTPRSSSPSDWHRRVKPTWLPRWLWSSYLIPWVKIFSGDYCTFCFFKQQQHEYAKQMLRKWHCWGNFFLVEFGFDSRSSADRFAAAATEAPEADPHRFPFPSFCFVVQVKDFLKIMWKLCHHKYHL